MNIIKNLLFKTLGGTIEEEVKSTVLQNEYYLKNKWTFLERTIVKISQFPISFSFFILFIFILVSFVIFQSTSILGYINIPSVTFLLKDWLYVSDVNELIFNGQLTILALIFPLVVGFVGVLIKDEVANQSLWTIYGRYSGFMIVGYSGLLLSASMVLVSLLTPFTPEPLEISMGISFVLWFLFNLALVAWLLYSTFSFINSKKQNDIITKFAINMTIIQQIKSRLYQLLPSNAIQLNLLPHMETEQIEITFFDYNNDYKAIVKKEFTTEKYLDSINYTVLSFLLKLLLYRFRKHTQNNKLTIVLPTTGDKSPFQSYTLAKLSDGNFLFYEKWLLKLSFSFSKKQKYIDDDDLVANLLFNDIDKALNSDNQRLYKQAVRKLQNYIMVIFGVSSFEHDDGKVDNWLLLSNNSFFNISLFHDISKEFYTLNKAVISKTLESQAYMHEFCYFYQYTFNESKIKLHNSIKKDLLEAHAHLWDELVSNKALSEKSYFPDLCIDFIGGWESWSRRREKDLETWEEIQEHTIFYEHYLMISCKLVLKANQYDNQEGAIWAISILNNWFENIFGLGGENTSQYFWKTTFLNTEILKEKDNAVLNFVIDNNELNIHDAYTIAHYNRHLMSTVMICILLIGNSKNFINKNTKRNISLLISGARNTTKTPSEVLIRSGNHIDFIKILETYILSLSPFTRSTKNHVGKSLIEYFQDLNRGNKISGRVYGGSVDGIASYISELKILLISTYLSKQDISEDIYDFIYSPLFPLNSQSSLINDIKKLLDIDETIKEKVQQLVKVDDLDSQIESYITTIETIIKKIEFTAITSLEESEVSTERLQKIKEYCSKPAFEKSSNDVPIKFFKSVRYLNEFSGSKKIDFTIPNYDKSRLCDSGFIHYTDEKNSFYNKMKNKLTSTIFNEMFQLTKKKIGTSEFKSIKNLVKSVVKTNNGNQDNIVLIFSKDIASNIRKTRYSTELEGLIHGISYGLDDHHLLYIDNAEVYIFNGYELNYCLLLNKNFFEKLEVKRYDDGIYVDVEFIPYKENIAQGDLKVSAAYSVTFDSSSSINKYILN